MFISSPKVIANALKRGLEGSVCEIAEADKRYIIDCIAQALRSDSAGFDAQAFHELMKEAPEEVCC